MYMHLHLHTLTHTLVAELNAVFLITPSTSLLPAFGAGTMQTVGARAAYT